MIKLWRSRTGQLGTSAVFIGLCSAISLAGNTSLHAQPRFDGAGYAMLALSLATGQGYRDIALPEPSRHTHFPPGYPSALAVLWRITGRSLLAAHLFSCACTIGATLTAWLWFRSFYPPRVAFILGLALSVNWTWGRYGGAVLSEPLFLLLGQLALLAAIRAGRCGGMVAGVVLGALLAACALTRHVGIALAAALGIDLILRRRWLTAGAAGLTWGALLLPWIGWLVLAGTPNQVSLLASNDESFWHRISALAIFYLQRLPDQLTGPFVEVGTVFQHRTWIFAAVTVWAGMASGVLAVGLVLTLRLRRRRTAGLSALATLGVLLVWPFTEAGRFLIPLVPCLLVGSLDGVALFMARCKFRRSRIWAASALLAVSLPFATYAIVSARAEAQRRTYREFDRACAWIALEATRAGPILARHPGEVFWQTGRRSLSPSVGEPESIDWLIDRFNVAYLLIDEDGYANSESRLLSRYVAQRPSRTREVWKSTSGAASVIIYECDRNLDDKN
jgi:Dolichyl-phosphate-mannose-protein mannosyltransferase